MPLQAIEYEYYLPKDGEKMPVSEFVEKVESGKIHQEYITVETKNITLQELKEKHLGKTGCFKEEEWFSDCDESGVQYVVTKIVYCVEE